MNPPCPARLADKISRLSTLFSLVLVVVATLLSVTCSHAAARTVRAGIYNFKPLVYSDTDGSARGLFVKILDHIAHKKNWNVKYVPGTWQEGVERLKSNQIDLLLCIGYTEERDKYLDFPKEFLLLDWGLVYKSKGSSINTIMDLKGKTVTVLKGSVYHEGFQELVKKFQIPVTILEMSQASDVLASVASGKADAGVAANLSGILNEAWQQLERTPIIFSPVRLGYGVNSGVNADLLEALDLEIAALKTNTGSIYYHELEHLLGNKDSAIAKEVYWMFYGVTVVLLLAITFIVLLKRQVKVKTEHLEIEIAGRKSEEEQIKSLSRRLLLATSSAHLGVWDWNVRDNTMVWDDRMFELYGITRETFPSNIDAWLNGLHPEDKERAIAECQTALKGEKEFDTVFRVLHQDGTVKYIKADGLVIMGADGTAERMLGINADITESKRAEETLRESEERFKKMFLNHSAVMLLIEPESGVIIDANLAAEEFYGYSHERLQSINISHINILSPELIVTERHAAIEEKRNHFIFPHRLAGGAIRTVEVYSTPITVNNSTLLFSIVHDITERKQAEQELQESTDFINAVVENVPLMIFLKEATELRFVLFNRAGEELLGYDREVLLGKNNLDLFPPEQAANFMTKDREVLDGDVGVLDIPEEPIMTAKNGLRLLHTRKVCIRGVDGVTKYLLGISEDITERKRAEQELLAKNTEMERFTYTVSHDLKSPLITIQTYAGMIRKDMEAGRHERAMEDMKRIEDAAGRMNALLGDLLQLSRVGRQMNESTQVDMNRLVKETLAQLAGPIMESRVELAVQPDLPAIHGDHKRIAEVMQNLIENAIKYRGDQAEPHIEIGTRQEGTEQVFFVQDNGIGIEPRYHESVFGLFNKLDAKSSGTGVGLALVKRIIEVHGGRVWVESAGKLMGSRFCFTVGV